MARTQGTTTTSPAPIQAAMRDLYAQNLDAALTASQEGLPITAMVGHQRGVFHITVERRTNGLASLYTAMVHWLPANYTLHSTAYASAMGILHWLDDTVGFADVDWFSQA